MDDYRQKPGSPGDILEHHGIKGMKWGVRKKEETSDRSGAGRNEESKDVLKPSFVTKIPSTTTFALDIPNANKTAEKISSVQVKSKTSTSEEHKSDDHQGLTPNQKKALVALGVTAGVAGFIAYKHYAKSPLIKPDVFGFDPRDLAKGPISTQKIGTLGKGHAAFDLISPETLHVDVSKGYADIRPIGGFANEFVAARHAEMIESLDIFREKYPSIRNMNLEVVPMSRQPGFGEVYANQSCYAAVMGIRPGEARIFYNDLRGAPDAAEIAGALRTFPGMDKKGALGAHEMGHLLAFAGGKQMPAFDVSNMPTNTVNEAVAQIRAMAKLTRTQNRAHKELFEKHGLSYKELSKLSPYAASQPAEALAELSRYYHGPNPGVGNDLSPEMRVKAKALFDDLGGVNVDRGVGSRTLEKIGGSSR